MSGQVKDVKALVQTAVQDALQRNKPAIEQKVSIKTDFYENKIKQLEQKIEAKEAEVTDLKLVVNDQSQVIKSQAVGNAEMERKAVEQQQKVHEQVVSRLKSQIE